MAGIRKMLIVLLFYISGVACEYLRLREGGKCFWKGLNGTCTFIHQCPGIRHTINNGINLEIEDFQAICAYRHKEPLICCRDCYIDTTANRSSRFNPHLGTLRKTGQKSSDKFLDYLDKLQYPCKLHLRANIRRYITDGNNCYAVSEGHSGFQSNGVVYPRDQTLLHTALLGFGKDLDSAQWLCGGSIISEKFILTSANCTSHPQLGDVRFAAMGMFNTTNPDQNWQRYTLKRIIPYPDYQQRSKYHDIALLETEGVIHFNEFVLPSNIFTDGRYDDKADAISWKSLGNGADLSETLQSVYRSSLFEYSELQCSLLYPPQEQLKSGYNHTIQMCYGYKGKPSDLCVGDNGGSLQNKWHTSSCGMTVLGVTSLNRTCGEVGGSGLYTRVKYYMPWIESIVWP